MSEDYDELRLEMFADRCAKLHKALQDIQNIMEYQLGFYNHPNISEVGIKVTQINRIQQILDEVL